MPKTSNFFSDIGSISPFSYFSTNPAFRGSHVEYFTQEDPEPSEVKIVPNNVQQSAEILTPNSPLYSNDEVFYPVETSDDDGSDDESNFYYIDEPDEESPAVSSSSFASYPSYPPLAPAPAPEQNRPVLTYKSAYSSQDLVPQNKLPETLKTPDGTTFYLVGVENKEESAPPPAEEFTPSPVYYKPLLTPDAQQVETEVGAAPDDAPDAAADPPVIYYR